ncbi:hypothetical protein Tco_0156312 [Tanacetum coccineum]
MSMEACECPRGPNEDRLKAFLKKFNLSRFGKTERVFYEEDIPKENFIIFSNPLFDLDEEIASTKVDRINDEVLEGIHSIPPGIDSFDAESDLVESVLNQDISIDSSPKIDSLSNEFAGELILPKSIPPEIEEVEFDTEGDILFLESLLYDNSSPRPPEALQANSNAIESLPPSHIPVADNDSLMEEIDLFLADDGSIPSVLSDDVDSDCPDCEDSQFCHSSRVSHPQLHLGIRYPNLID